MDIMEGYIMLEYGGREGVKKIGKVCLLYFLIEHATFFEASSRRLLMFCKLFFDFTEQKGGHTDL